MRLSPRSRVAGGREVPFAEHRPFERQRHVVGGERRSWCGCGGHCLLLSGSRAGTRSYAAPSPPAQLLAAGVLLGSLRLLRRGRSSRTCRRGLRPLTLLTRCHVLAPSQQALPPRRHACRRLRRHWCVATVAIRRGRGLSDTLCRALRRAHWVHHPICGTRPLGTRREMEEPDSPETRRSRRAVSHKLARPVCGHGIAATLRVARVRARSRRGAEVLSDFLPTSRAGSATR